MPVDDGDGTATVKLDSRDKKVTAAMMERTMSDPTTDPTTGAELGAGPGAGRTKEGDMGGAPDAGGATKPRTRK
jgi:Mn-containing catalase